MSQSTVRGQALVEYGLILAMIVAATLIGLIIPLAILMVVVRAIKNRRATA